jgi:hypothetical protein
MGTVDIAPLENGRGRGAWSQHGYWERPAVLIAAQVTHAIF